MASTDCLLEPVVLANSIQVPSTSYYQGTPVVGRAFSIATSYVLY